MSKFKTILGELTGAYGGGQAALPFSERMRHAYILGKSGTGKSTLLHNLAVQDILAGQGLALIDPHGDLCEALLEHIPRSRTRDVVYLNLADFEYPVSWNPLEVQAALPVATIAAHLVSACKHIWRDSWGPRMEYVLTNMLHALIEAECSLLSVPQFLTNKAFRAKIIARVRDPKVRHFFEHEFANFEPRLLSEIVSPIQNKIGQLLSHEAVRNVFARPHSSIDLRFIMDNRRILLVNLAKGQIGDEPANLFGSLLVSMIGAVALARGVLPEAERTPFFLYIDEFQNFSTDRFSSMLSEVRKYALGLVLAHQFVGQISDTIRQAIFGNVATRIFFAVGSEDAQALSLEIAHSHLSTHQT